VEDAEEAIEMDEESEEARVPKVLENPFQRTAREVAEHNLTHLPFRDWCPHCIMGEAWGFVLSLAFRVTQLNSLGLEGCLTGAFGDAISLCRMSIACLALSGYPVPFLEPLAAASAVTVPCVVACGLWGGSG
jgi:hypothetical protein